MSTRTRICGGLIAVGMAVLLAGCGTHRTTSLDSPAPISAEPTPAANAYVGSVIHSRGLATAALGVDVTTTEQGVTRTLHGTGVSALDRGYGDMTWTDASGTTWRELSDGKGLFVQEDVPHGGWTLLPSQTATPTGRLTDPLRGLGTMSNARATGSDVIDGMSTTRYEGTIPADPAALALLGLSDATLAKVGDVSRTTDIAVTVWIDGHSQVVRIDRTVDVPDSAAGPVSAQTSTTITEYMKLIGLDPPPTESVTSTPSAS